jgi:hypothetical protein
MKARTALNFKIWIKYKLNSKIDIEYKTSVTNNYEWYLLKI